MSETYSKRLSDLAPQEGQTMLLWMRSILFARLLSLEQESVGIALPLEVGGSICDIRTMDQEMLAKTADLLLRHIVVTIRVQQDTEIFANDMRLAKTGCVMAICRTRLPGSIMRASAHHLLIASALFPAFLQPIHSLYANGAG